MKERIHEVIKLDKIVPGGQTLGRLNDGRKVFVWGGLPGETVEVEITKSKRTYGEAIVVSVLEAAPERIVPKDACYLSTSPWQIMTAASEIKYKSDLVVDMFAQAGLSIPRVEIAGDDKFYNYRNKMEYSLWWDNETNRIWPAFHRRGSHQKILVTSSSIERPEIWAEVQRIISGLNNKGDEARRYQSILIRCNQAGQISSGLFEMNKPHPIMSNLTDSILGHNYTYSPNGFFQINLPVYELALNAMAPYIQTEEVVDMYSGVGTIGLSIARNHRLILIETDNSAFKELEHNLAESGIAQARAVHAKSEEALEYITGNTSIVLDPPRAGLDSLVVKRLNDQKPPLIIYLSCNPITQARDIAKLINSYSIVYSQPFNFFPRTPHIENLVVLKRN